MMQINGHVFTQIKYLSLTGSRAAQKTDTGSFQSMMSGGGTDVVSYYDALCREFPEITFRLGGSSDRAEGEYDTGYQGSSHQRGNGFSMPGQCSIEIDYKVIEKMMSDETYAAKVKGIIQNLESNYSTYEGFSRKDGFQYTNAEIMEDEAGLTYCIASSRCPVNSAEDAAKLRGEGSGRKILTQRMIERAAHQKNEAQEAFFEMMDESRRKSLGEK